VLYLYSLKRPVTTDELASSLGYSKKSILDSLRKLEKKDLVVKVKAGEELTVSLSDKGMEFVTRIIELFKLSPPAVEEPALTVPVRINIAREVVTAINIYKLVVYLGLARFNRPVSLRALSKPIGVNKEELEVIVNSFAQPPTKLFRIVKVNNEEAVLLDKQGVELLRKTPHYKAYVSNKLYRALVRATSTPWINEIMVKINLLCAGLIAAAIAILIVLGITSWVVAVAAASTAVALSVLDILVYVLTSKDTLKAF